MKKYAGMFFALCVAICLAGAGMGQAAAPIDASGDRVITETVGMDGFHGKNGALLNSVPDFITAWEFRAGDTPVLFPFEWESRWEGLSEQFSYETGECNRLLLYVKAEYLPNWDFGMDTKPAIILDVLDENKRVIRSGLELGVFSTIFSDAELRLINDRVAQQRTRTIYFRVSIDMTNFDKKSYDIAESRFRQLRIALGVEHLTNLNAAPEEKYQRVYGRYLDAMVEFDELHPAPEKSH